MKSGIIVPNSGLCMMEKQQHEQEMKALNFLPGTWNTTGEIVVNGETPATIIKGTDRYEWILNGCFILHKVDVMMGDDKIEAIELIGEFDKVKKTYKMRSFDNHGNFMTMEAHFDENGALQIEGDNMRSELSVVDSNNMNAHWERSEDNKTWQPWMDLKLSK